MIFLFLILVDERMVDSYSPSPTTNDALVMATDVSIVEVPADTPTFAPVVSSTVTIPKAPAITTTTITAPVNDNTLIISLAVLVLNDVDSTITAAVVYNHAALASVTTGSVLAAADTSAASATNTTTADTTIAPIDNEGDKKEGNVNFHNF